MKKSAIFKNTVRSIFRSPGRYLAILGIIMLGAGFFVGLRATRDSMIKTADRYLKDSRFFDFQLISTLGFSRSAAEKITTGPDIAAAEGAVQLDALVAFTADDHVLRFHALPSKINLPEVTEGRLPVRDDEILLDTVLSGSVILGDEIVLSSLNTEDTLSSFTHDSYTVVGFATSPLYMNYERGNTLLGSGSVTGFAYILPDGFTLDYYTSLYISAGYLGAIYTDTYENAADRLEPVFAELAEAQADVRYREIISDNTGKLEDAEREYADGMKEYEDQKADVLKQLGDAEQQLAEALKQLEDGRAEYEAGVKDLADGKEKAETELANGEAALTEALIKLSEGEKAYGEGLAKYQAGEAQYQAGLTQYNASMDQYSQLFTLYDRYLDFHTASDTVRSSLSQVLEDITGINLDTELSPEERVKLISEIWDSSSEVIGASVNELIKSSRALAKELSARYGNTEAVKNFTARIDALEKAMKILEGDDLNLALKDLLTATGSLYEGASGLINEISSQLPQIQQQMSAARQQLAASRIQLNNARQQLAASRKELDDGWDAYFEGEKALSQAREDAQAELEEGETALAEALKQLEEGQAEYDQGVLDLESAKKEAEEKLAEAEEKLRDARAEIDDGWEKLRSLEEPSVYTLGRWSNIGYACLDSDSQIVSSISKVFPVFFFLVAALICMTTMARMVEEQRGQLGVLLALGYSRLTVMSKFLIYAGSAAFMGCAVGIPLFSFLFPQIIWQAYRIMYGFSKTLIFSLDWELFGITTGLYLAAMLLVTYVSLRGQLSDTPASILRPKAPQLGKRVLLERIPFLWKRLDFMWKVTMRNIFRYRNRVLMMLLGVAGCTALMITGYGIRDSIQDIVGYQYGEITRYEYEVSFSDPLDEEAMDRFAQTARRYSGEPLFVYSQSVTAKKDRYEKNAYLLSADAADPFEDYLSLHSGKESLPFPGPGQTIINNGLADDLDLEKGDTIQLMLNGTEYTLTVSGVFDNYIYNYLIVSDQGFEQMTGDAPQKKTALVLKREGAADATARLLGADGVVNVTAGSILRDRIGSIMDNLIYIVLLTIICAAALAFIVIYNLININITERLREIATVKVLGFYRREAAIYVLRENILLTGLGALLGVPLGILLNSYVMGSIKVDLVTFVARVKFPSFLWSIGFTLLFSVLVYMIMMRKLDKIDMAAALKAAE